MNLPHVPKTRALLALAGVGAALVAPPWVALVCIVVLALRYAAWEALFIGLMIDLAWLPIVSLHQIPVYTLLAIVIVWGLGPVRSRFL